MTWLSNSISYYILENKNKNLKKTHGQQKITAALYTTANIWKQIRVHQKMNG